ncbi:sigma 54-interacting transcriptional regulator [Paraliomyxa miuraensis]|uniref:sigma 54-interacting transcriptional regulator n=1 Tax=Paraliomyxa miuraensis TaxID=376150 RepID=UPI002257331A|nr:sigma 54-interacting transcriptional regulator [Paraliomyxa miuraensis]MCX4241078.1 sigma 54-interacting transcriptional regulator [Paraliomyxa miuraensis]
MSTSGNHFGHGIRQVESLTRSARGGLPPAPSPTSGFDARTPARSYALTLARRVASSRCAVLIVGPTGVGKEVLAEEIHRRGDRAGKRFLAINCAAIAPSLFESTFFGHTRGAFSGATSDKPGLVELANGGTLFLDEVGELSLDAQAKLLRFLAKGTYWPVGGTSEQHVDVRVIAATHRDIGAEDTKSFREDLFYRLSTITIRIPGLDARDVETIARSIATEVAESHGVVISEDDAMALTTRCAAHEWKGGVRELRNAIERLMILWNPGRPREEVFAEVLGQRPSPSSPSPHVPSVNVSKDLDNLLFLGVAEQCADVKELASRTERTVQAIYGRLKKLDLTPQDVGPTPRLEARKANLRRRLAPELPWIQRLLTE